MTGDAADQYAVDKIATLLGTAPNWDGAADYLEAIADTIGAVRPHPGIVDGDEYRAMFYGATGRDVVPEFDSTR